MTLSTPTVADPSLGAAANRDRRSRADNYLFSPTIDFLCLGGGSLLVFIPLMFLDNISIQPAFAATILFIAHFINSPHFAHSYQIFYRNFRGKAFGANYTPQLRARYVFAGIVVPLGLISFFCIATLSENARVLGFGFNIMLFLVGWHYVKQGYGMLIVDSVLKKNFFNDSEKRILVLNAYACWLLGWAFLNKAVAERDMFGLTAFSLPVPSYLLAVAAVLTAATTVMSLVILLRFWRSGATAPINGIVAYLVTLYLWILFPSIVEPAAFVILLVLATPAAHSIQYLAVVWRYQLNIEQATKRPIRRFSLFSKPLPRLAYFYMFGVVIAFSGFWIIPTAFDLFVSYDRSIFGGQMFLFMFAIFINVHHYFLDNVMWRRENPDVAKHLFKTA